MAYRSAFSTEFIKDRVQTGVGKLGCWLWQMWTDSEGYGRLGPGAPERFAHRLAYHLFIGPIPEGMTVDHICFVPSCVNPDHLRLLTPSENCKRQRMQAQFVDGTYQARRGMSVRAGYCGNGHEMNSANLYVSPKGAKVCRPCNREARKRYRARKAAA